MAMACRIVRKRVYLPPEPSDGRRILADRLWPRGMTKERAALTDWRKDLAPSPALRQWFCHDPARFGAFAAAYRGELAENPAARAFAAECAALSDTETVTLLYAAKDETCNHTAVLRDWLAETAETLTVHDGKR